MVFAFKCVFAVCGHNHHTMKKITPLLLKGRLIVISLSQFFFF